MTMYKWLAAAALAAPLAAVHPAYAKPGDPIAIEGGASFDPIIEGNLRYETVDQDNVAGSADALTMRLRAGGELKIGGLGILAEAEGTLAMIDNYNDTIPGNGVEPYPVVADPDNVELNRLQISYTAPGGSVTLGRQRIIHDNARFVGNVGWRQNEQTFDAVRGQTKIGPVSLDATYAISQRTIYGWESPNTEFEGNFWLLNGGLDLKTLKIKGFAYLLDYDKRLAFSSQTYGVTAAADIPLGSAVKLNAKASFARQKDYALNPVSYSADYISAEVGATVAGFGLSAGYEELGSDGGVAAFQTPLATLHAFNGWADLFLTTPAAGLRDYYGSIGRGFGDAGPLKGLSAKVTYHKFESDFGGVNYGGEWDASLGFKVKNYSVMLKYARYEAKGFATDTEKFWAQVSFAY